MASYSLAAKFASEYVAMTLTIWFGESCLANTLLPGTKGHAMGLLAVALGFGLAFGVNIAWFGGISARVNPAILFFLAILGKLEEGWIEFVALSCAEVLGAFSGAVLVYFHFLPHFRTVPLPKDTADRGHLAVLVHGFPDALGTSAARIASAFGTESHRPDGGVTLREEIQNMLDFQRRPSHSVSQRDVLLEKMEVRRVERTKTHRRRHSAQIAGLLHTHDPSLSFEAIGEEEEKKSSDDIGKGEERTKTHKRRHSVQIAGLLHTHDPGLSLKDIGEEDETKSNDDNGNGGEDIEIKIGDGLEKKNDNIQLDDEVFNAALNADALAKLSIFASRPAKYHRPSNFYQEMSATAALCFGIEMFKLRRATDVSVEADGAFLQALFVALFITMLVLGLGGTTGPAMNPARDFGPRLAHQWLPIPGKGRSEWDYAWVPCLAPFVGAALAAGVYSAVELMFETESF